jgi:hypothetical protein
VDFLSGGKLCCERTRALEKTGNFLGIFGEFLECLEWLGPNRKYLSEAEGPAAILPMRRDCGAIYNKLRGLNAKL